MLNFLSVEKSHSPHLKVWAITVKLDVSEAKKEAVIHEWNIANLLSKFKNKLCSALFIDYGKK